MKHTDSFEDDVHEVSSNAPVMENRVNADRQRFPFCVVWTPLPMITYFFPFIGHMGIATSTGVIRDFAGPYHVSEGNMAFGQPTKYWQLNPAKVRGGVQGWDSSVAEASEVYKTRMHNICCDNCHSHVGMALRLMEYDGKTNWNMVKLALYILIYGKYVSLLGFLKTWLPFTIIFSIILTLSLIY